MAFGIDFEYNLLYFYAMRNIVSLVRGKEEFKHGDWLLFDRMLKVGAEINVVKPDESGDKIRVFRVIGIRGFKHQLAAYDKRNRVKGLEKGMKFIYLIK